VCVCVQVVSEAEADDLNRARSYLRDVAARRGARCFSTLDGALAWIVEQIGE
jgi:hypothetical protein